MAWTNYKNFGQIEKLKIGEQQIFTDGEMEKWTEMQKLESLQGTDRADCCIPAGRSIFKGIGNPDKNQEINTQFQGNVDIGNTDAKNQEINT